MKSAEGLPRGPASHGDIAVVQDGFAQTARSEEVPDIVVDIALLGTALVSDAETPPCGVVV